MGAVLKECSYNKAHNFNLLSMSRLLNNQGNKIKHGSNSLIGMENKKDKVIEFDIVVPLSKPAVYARRFVRSMEVVVASTEAGKKINGNIAHCLLGHRNEDSVWKTVHELGWVLTCSTMHECKYCSKSKVKQKNFKKANVAEKAMVSGQRL